MTQVQPDSFSTQVHVHLLLACQYFYRVKCDVLVVKHSIPGKGLEIVLLRIVNTDGTID